MLQVEKDIIQDANNGLQRKFCYKDVEYDCDGWADASKYLPADFDLMYLKTADNIYNGWMSRSRWDGLKITGDDKVFFWKRHNQVVKELSPYDRINEDIRKYYDVQKCLKCYKLGDIIIASK